MEQRLEIRQWMRLNHPAFTVSLSGDGQYAAVGHEQGVAIFDITGQRLFTYPDRPLPVHQVALTPDLKQLYIATRLGWLTRLELERVGASFTVQAYDLYRALDDLHTLSISADGAFAAVGHLSPALAVLEKDGHIFWRSHPADGNATEGQVWSVALDAEGESLYVGSAGAGANHLAVLEARSAYPRAHLYLDPGVRVTALTTLPHGKGIAAVLTEDPYAGRLQVYDSTLTNLIWGCSFDEPITALAADRQQALLVVGVGYAGKVILLNAEDGRRLGVELLKSVVNGLAISQGRTLAAATQDGHLIFIRYRPEEFRL